MLGRPFITGNRAHRAQLLLLLSPYLLGLVVLVLGPMAMTVALSLTDYDIFTPPVWNHFSNYQHFLVDQRFQLALLNSLWFVVGAVGLRLGGALLLALALNHTGRLYQLARAAVYLPLLMPEVAYAFVWLLLLNPEYGPVNLVLGQFGLPRPAWLQVDWSARLTLVLMTAFELGEGFVLLLAARQTIPSAVLEAAALDGSNRWHNFRHVYVPLLAPALLLLACRDTALSFQYVFVPALITTETGPYYATYFLPHYVFNEAFGLFRYGYGAAVTVLIYAVSLAMIGTQFLAVQGDTRFDES